MVPIDPNTSTFGRNIFFLITKAPTNIYILYILRINLKMRKKHRNILFMTEIKIKTKH